MIFILINTSSQHIEGIHGPEISNRHAEVRGMTIAVKGFADRLEALAGGH